MRIVVVNHLSLDGVMQSPARPDEDEREGFTQGGWATAHGDEAVARAMGFRPDASGGAMLFGRRTYEDFFRVWPPRKDNPVSGVLDRARKYVASRTLREPLPWQNSVLLRGDAAESVARVRRESGGDLVVLGSGELVRSLARAGLVDSYVLAVHPIVLGAGRRLFEQGFAPARLRLASATPTPSGVVVATYERT